MADEERVEPTLDLNGGVPPPPIVEQVELEEEKPKSKKMLFFKYNFFNCFHTE